MKIEQTRDNSTLTLALEGRLDTITAPELEQVVNANLEGLTALIFDFAKLEYVSSAGLRVLLSALPPVQVRTWTGNPGRAGSLSGQAIST